MPTASDILSAIVDVADADAGLLAGFGRASWLWKLSAPPTTPLPYAVVFEAGAAKVGQAFGARYHEDVLVQFNVFSEDAARAQALGAAIRDSFAPRQDVPPLALSGGEDRWRWLGDGDACEADGHGPEDGDLVYVQRVNFVWRVLRAY